MKVDLVHLVALGIYAIGFVATLLGVGFWRKRRANLRWPVETKLRRGPGESLQNRDDIDQTIAQADWLRKWIEQRTGLKTPVRPILTMPGWYGREKPSKEIRVVNSKILPDAVRGRGERVLSNEQIDLIARQRDLACRDVED